MKSFLSFQVIYQFIFVRISQKTFVRGLFKVTITYTDIADVMDEYEYSRLEEKITIRRGLWYRKVTKMQLHKNKNASSEKS